MFSFFDTCNALFDMLYNPFSNPTFFTEIVVSKLEAMTVEDLARILIQARKTSLLDFEN